MTALEDNNDDIAHDNLEEIGRCGDELTRTFRRKSARAKRLVRECRPTFEKSEPIKLGCYRLSS